jgi:hypothetical protein
VQRLLALFANHLLEHTSKESLSNFLIEETKETGAFPHLRIQSYDAREELLRFIIKSLEDNEWSLPQHLRKMAIEFVTTETPSQSTQNAIIACSEDDIRVRQTVLCLRGMISADILLNALMEKRWRVHYGLDLKRSPLAVPFRAKDCPSARSEFGHPDMTILLTCLSYYYRGLDDDMIWQTITYLLKSDTPDLTYTEWLGSHLDNVPRELRTIRGVNMEDNASLKKTLYPLLKYNKRVVDFYLNAFVFPRYAKQFPYRLSSSGWDLAIKKTHLTTGFSGTNDA